MAWGNVNVYDHNGELTTDRTTLRMWPVPRGMTELLYPLGCVGANLDREAPALELELEPLNNPAVHYPEFLEAKKYAEMSEARRIADRNRQIPVGGDFCYYDLLLAKLCLCLTTTGRSYADCQ